MPDGNSSISLPLFPVFHPRTHFNTCGLPCLPAGISVFSFYCPARARNHGYPQSIPSSQDSDTTDLVSPSASILSNTPISLETNYEMNNARCKGKTNFLLALLFLLATLRPKLPASASGAKCPSHGSRPVPAQGPSMMVFVDGCFSPGPCRRISTLKGAISQ